MVERGAGGGGGGEVRGYEAPGGMEEQITEGRMGGGE